MKNASRLSDIRVMTEDQLNDEALKLKKEQFNLRFQKASGQLQDTARVRVVRRDLARVMTVAAQKRTGEVPKVKAVAAPAATRAKPKRTAKPRSPVKTRSKPSLKSRAKAKRK